MTSETPADRKPTPEERAEWKAWQLAYSDQICDSVNTLRAWAGLTIKDLSLRLQFHGWPIDAMTLNGILSGYKRGSFSIGEILVFAKALHVSPAFIMAALPGAESLPQGESWATNQKRGVPTPSALGRVSIAPVFPDGGMDAPSLLAWLNRSSLAQPSYPGDETSQEILGMTNTAARIVTLLRHYEDSLRVAIWQNALLTELPRLGLQEEKFIPDFVKGGGALRQTLGNLWQHIADNAALGERAISLPALPASLEFVAAQDFDPDQVQLPIPGLNTDGELKRARKHLVSVAADHGYLSWTN